MKLYPYRRNLDYVNANFELGGWLGLSEGWGAHKAGAGNSFWSEVTLKLLDITPCLAGGICRCRLKASGLCRPRITVRSSMGIVKDTQA